MTLRRLIESLSLAAVLGAGTLAGRTALAAPLTPEEALARAVDRSPELRAALAELESARLGVLGADRARDWVLRASLQGQYAEQFADTSEGATLNSTQTVGGSVGVSRTTEIGTVIQIGLDARSRWQRVNQDVGTANEIVLGPTISADLSFDITQPLLRGGGTDSVLAAMRQARTQERLAQLAKDESASSVALEVMRAYWNLWLAEQALAVERASLALTARQLADVEARAGLGTAPRTDVLRLASQEAAARQGLVAAEALLAERQFALARHLGVSMREAATLSAVGVPAAPATAPALEDLIALAADGSTAILQLELQIELARERVALAADRAEPRLDLWASVGAGGLWTEGPPTGLALPGGRPAFLALVGLDFELPLSESSADAELAQARADKRAAELRLQARSETLAAEVATLHRSLTTLQDAARAAAVTASFAAELADKEDQRLKLGTALVSEVISAQQAQREAELARLRAEADVALAALELDHVSGQLLTRLALTIPTPNPSTRTENPR